MNLTANSVIAYAGKKYLPGQSLPGDVPADVRAEWLRVGYAVEAKGQGTPTAPPLAAPSESMTTAQLKELAVLYGVDAGKAKNKAEIIAMIVATGKVPA